MMWKIPVAAVSLTAASFVFGQAEIEDRPIIDNVAEVQPAAPTANQTMGELYYQVQLLQQEVSMLRGLMEEQAFQIKKLKQQRLDDYVDLDRRISQLGSAAAPANPAGKPLPPGTPQTAIASPVSNEDEFKRYKEAYRLATQDPVAAEKALEAFNRDFPNSRYVANALFVLGEIKLKNGELDAARSWFARVINEHPNHYRVPNAKLKLGQVYQLMDDMPQAKRYWTEVADSGSNAAVKAKEYLAEYFPQ